MSSPVPIPNIFHFVFGLKPQTEPFHLAYYLCLKSCLEVNRPEVIYFHYHHRPYGEWWDRIRPELTLREIVPEPFIENTDRYDGHREGRYIKERNLQYAHHADFARLRVLLEHGGVYADIDTIFIRPYPRALFEFEFVLGRERPGYASQGGIRTLLCNALILSRPGARFARTWLENMYSRFDGRWNEHCCALAADLMRQYPDQLHVAPREYFYRFMWTRSDLELLFKKDARNLNLDDAYSIHLWNHLWWDEDRTDFTDFHAGDITVENIRGIDTTFNRLVRRFLPD